MEETRRIRRIRPVGRIGGLAAVAALALAACGGDDDGPPDGATGGSDDDDGGRDGDGGPYSLFSGALHDGVELPDPGTATLTVDGFTLVFESLDQCEVGEASEGRAEAFLANGATELDDGREARFSLFRSVLTSETQAAGDSVETDSANVWVQIEGGEPAESNTYLRGDRMEAGGGVSGRADELPFIYVVDDGGALAATAVGDIARLSADMPDGAPEGTATFAVNCG